MATKGEGKPKKGEKGEKRSAKKLDDALNSLASNGTPQPEGSETNETQELTVTEETVPKDPSPEPVYDEPTLSEIIVER